MQSAWDIESDVRPLRAFLLGMLPWPTLLALQRRLVYEVSGDPRLATLIVCEHAISITMGRQASRVHVRLSPEQLSDRGWSLEWVARGGGCWLHTPGQVAIYSILPLDNYALSAAEYVATLTQAVGVVVRQYVADAVCDAGGDHHGPGIRVRGRRVAAIGTAVRAGVSAFGAIINVNPDLALFELCSCDGDRWPMTSLLRESGRRVRIPTVRQQLVEAIASAFQIDRVSVHHHHPAFEELSRRHACPARGQ